MVTAFKRSAFLVLFLALAGCATAPGNINNVCSVFDQRDGWFNNWYGAAKRTERAYGVPVSVLMATIRVESGFKGNARPPRSKLLGFIPWKRPSSAYGYSQALDGTWAEYRRETGRWGARRSDFGDAIDFVGWYHRRSHERNGIPLNDAHNLYLAYYSGHAGYANGTWRNSPGVKRAAQKAASLASSYDAQIRSCRR